MRLFCVVDWLYDDVMLFRPVQWLVLLGRIEDFVVLLEKEKLKLGKISTRPLLSSWETI